MCKNRRFCEEVHRFYAELRFALYCRDRSKLGRLSSFDAKLVSTLARPPQIQNKVIASNALFFILHSVCRAFLFLRKSGKLEFQARAEKNSNN
jgi:hypothetical protein